MHAKPSPPKSRRPGNGRHEQKDEAETEAPQVEVSGNVEASGNEERGKAPASAAPSAEPRRTRGGTGVGRDLDH